ncbi:hypothetical protein BJ875DRAFT_450963 [Amylocarpus encephaloides]|uniref:Uncharacterized protein n=1 Tax=Amylocarpus encephaloides TaxID=45428 RepID=A0A9P7YRB2_9HELO|nr:hypothetical protein BJ875DRAFT_450963 [Amylocarpus encephaloides]
MALGGRWVLTLQSSARSIRHDLEWYCGHGRRWSRSSCAWHASIKGAASDRGRHSPSPLPPPEKIARAKISRLAPIKIQVQYDSINMAFPVASESVVPHRPCRKALPESLNWTLTPNAESPCSRTNHKRQQSPFCAFSVPTGPLRVLSTVLSVLRTVQYCTVQYYTTTPHRPTQSPLGSTSTPFAHGPCLLTRPRDLISSVIVATDSN